MEYNLKTKPLSEETLTFYDIHPENYIQQALLSESSYNNIVKLITFTDNIINTLTKEYHQKLIGQTEKLKDKSITLNILDTILHELTIQSIKLYIKELLTIMNNHEFKDKLNIIKKININHIDKILTSNKKEQKYYYEFYADEIKEKMDKLSFDDIRLEYKKYLTTNNVSDYFVEIIQNIFEFPTNK
jgi:hypothetical protein